MKCLVELRHVHQRDVAAVLVRSKHVLSTAFTQKAQVEVGTEKHATVEKEELLGCVRQSRKGFVVPIASKVLPSTFDGHMKRI